MWIAVVLYLAFTAFFLTIYFTAEPDPFIGVVLIYPILAFIPFCGFFVMKAFRVSRQKVREAERELQESKRRDELHGTARAPAPASPRPQVGVQPDALDPEHPRNRKATPGHTCIYRRRRRSVTATTTTSLKDVPSA